MLLSADRIVFDGFAYPDAGIEISEDGRIVAVAPLASLGKPDEVLKGKVLLPGMINAHSQAFQRILRGRTHFATPDRPDNFLLWRDSMYHVAGVMDPQSLYTVARQAFLEMLLSGITAVGEFHYLHYQPDGEAYDDPNAMGVALVQAARDVGIRMSLLQVVYLRGGLGLPLNPWQRRFADANIEVANERFESLVRKLLEFRDGRLAWGVAAHSLRAVDYDEVMSLKLRLAHMPFHIQVSAFDDEVDDCLEHHDKRPVELLASKELFDACTTLVHATHLTDQECDAIARLGAVVCMCPSTEADMGHGIGRAADLMRRGVSVALGTDAQMGTSLLAEARMAELNERLRYHTRNRIAPGGNSSVAAHLLNMATLNGARSLGIEAGALKSRKWADIAAFDITDPRLAGLDGWTLLPGLLMGDTPRATDVMVGGKFVIRDGKHQAASAITCDYETMMAGLYPQN